MNDEESWRLLNGRYLTIYNKDYIKRKSKPVERGTTVQEFKDPINESYKEYLVLDQQEVAEPLEDQEKYLEQLKEKKPKIISKHFATPIDKGTITTFNMYNKGKSVYQIDYCDIMGDVKRKEEKAKRKIVLPEDWNIPLTTQRYSYRNPLSMSEKAYDRVCMTKVPNNLGHNEKVNKILNIKTGNSEYNEIIGKLGDFIVTKQLHGEVYKF